MNKTAASLVVTTLTLVALLVPSCLPGDARSTAPRSPAPHYVPTPSLGDASRYWNTSWLGRAPELHQATEDLANTYLRTSQYVPGENDCNDMTVEFWGQLRAEAIISVIVAGNLERSGETTAECNHTWLMVYSGEGAAAAVDLVCSAVYTWEDVRANPQLRQYWEGFVYETPADLVADFRDRW